MRVVKLSVLVTALGVVAVPAMAQQGVGGMGMGGMGPGMGAVALQCNDDAARFCTGRAHGGGVVRDCLEKNIDKVSETCRAALKSTGRGRQR